MPAAESINLRISTKEKAIIDYAAQSLGKSRSAFILENTLRSAEEVLLDRTRFSLDSDQWKELVMVMDSAPSEEQISKLRRLFAVETPWNV